MIGCSFFQKTYVKIFNLSRLLENTSAAAIVRELWLCATSQLTLTVDFSWGSGRYGWSEEIAANRWPMNGFQFDPPGIGMRREGGGKGGCRDNAWSIKSHNVSRKWLEFVFTSGFGFLLHPAEQEERISAGKMLVSYDFYVQHGRPEHRTVVRVVSIKMNGVVGLDKEKGWSFWLVRVFLLSVDGDILSCHAKQSFVLRKI